MNTILDDIAAVIGFSATLKLVAWFGGGSRNIYVPASAEEGQLLPRIIGMAAARRLSQEWPKKTLNVPQLHNYDTELRRRSIARMTEKNYSVREIAVQLQMSERRVSQVKEELRASGLLPEKKEAEPARGQTVAPAAPNGLQTAMNRVVNLPRRPTLRAPARRAN